MFFIRNPITQIREHLLKTFCIVTHNSGRSITGLSTIAYLRIRSLAKHRIVEVQQPLNSLLTAPLFYRLFVKYKTSYERKVDVEPIQTKIAKVISNLKMKTYRKEMVFIAQDVLFNLLVLTNFKYFLVRVVCFQLTYSQN